jgi:hypothetical protein
MTVIILSVYHHLMHFYVTVQLWFQELNEKILLILRKTIYYIRNFAELHQGNFLDLYLKGS